jgi:CubicO group peptidase (beta-lactamase class C family)
MTDTSFDVPAEKMKRLARLHEFKGGQLRAAPEILGTYAEAGKGIPAGGAGLFSTVGDFARFAQCLLNDGKLDDVRILGRKTMERARLNSLPADIHAFAPSEDWGLVSAVRTDVAKSSEPGSVGMFYWSGAATTHFFCDPDEQLLGLVFCQHFTIDQHGLFRRFRTAVNQTLE